MIRLLPALQAQIRCRKAFQVWALITCAQSLHGERTPARGGRLLAG